MARRPASNAPTPANLNPDEMRRGIQRLRKRVEELRAVDVSALSSGSTVDLESLEKAVEESLARTFGAQSTDYARYHEAASLRFHEPLNFIFGGDYTQPATSLVKQLDAVAVKLTRSIGLLEQAIRGLEEEMSEEPGVQTKNSARRQDHIHISNKVFVVHGRESGPREAVARLLEKLGLEPIILNEQPNQGKTVIEKIETYGDVSFAVVLLTPDDQGALKGEELKARARQNVLLELGYFIGKLGRDRVCTLVGAEVEIPSDWRGVVDETFDQAGGWKLVLGRELQAAGHSVDWNVIMSVSRG